MTSTSQGISNTSFSDASGNGRVVLLAILNTVGDPTLRSLGKAALKVLGITSTMATDKSDCIALAERVQVLTRDILERACNRSASDGLGELVEPVKTVVEDIGAFLETQARQNVLQRVMRRNDVSREVDRLNGMLDTAMANFRTALTMSIRASQRMSGQQSLVRRKDLVHAPVMTLPAKPAIFYGRDDLVESIAKEILGPQAKHIAILGAGGMGKTTLAAAVLHDTGVVHKFSNRRYFIRCDGVTSADGIISAMAAALRLLDMEDPRRAVIQYFQFPGTARLLVLDNLESAWDTVDQTAVEQFMAELASINNLWLIITMRGGTRPAGVDWSYPLLSVLPPLQPADARHTFLSICGKDDLKLDELLVQLDGLPLAITLMAFQGQVLGVPDLLRAYEREKTTLLRRGRQRRLTSLEVSIEVSLNSLTMQERPNAKVLLSTLSLLPDGVETSRLPKIIPSLGGHAQAARTLLQLALATTQERRLRVLSPLRTFMLEYYPPQGSTLEELRLFFMRATAVVSRYGDLAASNDLAESSRDFGNTHAVLLHNWAESDTIAQSDSLLQATINISELSYLTAYGDCVPLLRKAITSCKALPARRPFLAEIGLMLGDLLQVHCHYDEAATALVQSRQVFEALGTRLGVALCTRTLAEVMRLQDRYDEAAEFFREAQAIFQQEKTPTGNAECVRSLADIFRMQGRYDEAIAEFMVARKIFEIVGERSGMAQCIQSIGDVYRLQSRYEEATAQLLDAKRIFDAIGQQLGVAQCLQSLGNIRRVQDRYEEAAEVFNQSMQLFETIDHQLGVAQCIQNIGNVLLSQHQYEEAVDKFTTARAMFERMGHQLGTAQCAQAAGDILYMQNQLDEAALTISDAQKSFLALGQSLGVAQCMQSLGDIYYMQDRYDEAASMLSEGKDMFETLGDKLGAAQCLHSLGDVSRFMGRSDEAISRLTEAKLVFEAIGDIRGMGQCAQSLGNVFLVEGRYAEAAACVTESREVFLSIGYQLGVAQSTQSLGTVLRLQKKYMAAAERFAEATRIFEGIGDQLGIAQCLRGLGNVFQMQEQYVDATAAFTEAKQMFDRVADTLGAAQCTQSLGDILRMQKSFTIAVNNIQSALQSYKEIGQRHGEAECCESLGRIFMEQGLSEEGGEMFGKAVAVFMELGLHADVARCRMASEMDVRSQEAQERIAQ